MCATYTYIATDGFRYKIGQSENPEKRIKQLATANPYIKLITYGLGITEKDLHKRFAHCRLKGEWFKLKKKQVEAIKNLILGQIYSIEVVASNTAQSEFYNKYKKYTIDFGKYNGRKLHTLKSKDELQYVKWYVENVYSNKKKEHRLQRDRYFAFHYMRNR